MLFYFRKSDLIINGHFYNCEVWVKEVIRDKRTSNTIRNRCRILLALDENQTSTTTYDDCAYYLGVSKPTICNVVKCYALEDIDKVLVRNRNLNSDNANRKIDGALEARIIAMACSNPRKDMPDGLWSYSQRKHESNSIYPPVRMPWDAC